jgi:hypothetical protein
MRNKTLVCCLAAALLASVGCGKYVTVNTNNSKPAASPASSTATQAASPASSTAAAPAEGNQDFTLVNQTGVEIHKVFISPHDVNDWEEDILGRDTLPNGESVDIKFHRSQKAPLWDLRIEDKQGHSIEWENLNLMQIDKITLEYKDGKATAKIG